MLSEDLFKTAGEEVDSPIAGTGQEYFGNKGFSSLLTNKYLSQQNSEWTKKGGKTKIQKLTDKQARAFIHLYPTPSLYGIKLDDNLRSAVSEQFSRLPTGNEEDEKIKVELTTETNEENFVSKILSLSQQKYKEAYIVALQLSAGVTDTKGLILKLLDNYKENDAEMNQAISGLVELTKDIK